MNYFKQLPQINKNGEFYDCGDSCNMTLYRDVSYFVYENYCKKLEEYGYTLLQTTEYENNHGKTFSGNGIILQCTHREYENCMRIIADTNLNLPLIKRPFVEKKYDTEFIQFETDHSLIDCGMCYLFRLYDGSFFLIDSANFYSVHDDERLHDFMRSKTPDGEKIKIAGWFFTHGHDDHINKALDYFKYRCTDTDIECVIYNFPPLNHRDGKHWSQSVKNMQKDFENYVDNSSLKHINIHSLQKFFIRNLEIDVLCTHEDVFSENMEDYNDSSTVIMIKTDGNKIFIPGDAARSESNVMLSSYSEKTLKCDILQLSHHGHTGLETQIYEMTQAPLLLIPNTKIKFDEEWDRREENRKVVEIADKYYLSSDGTVEITLPYKRTKQDIKIYSDETVENFDGIFQLWNYEYTDEFKRNIIDGFISRGGKLQTNNS